MRSTSTTLALGTEAVSRATESRLPKVLILTSGLQFDRGSAEEVATLSDSLTREGWRATARGCFSRPGSNGDRESDFGRLASGTGCIRELIRLIPRFEIVHIIAENPVSLVFFVIPALLLSKFLGKKVVLSFNLATADEFLERWDWMICPFLRMADRLVVNSDFLASVVEEFGLRAEVLATVHDPSTSAFRQVGRLQPKILVDRPLESPFNIGCLIRAFAFVKQKYPRAELVIAGKGTQRKSLESMVQTEGILGVSFIDGSVQDEHDSLFTEADLYIVPSSYDTMPRSILKAFASGLPVVTTDAGGITGLVKDKVNGQVVPINSHVALAERIFELIENPELVAQLTRQAQTDARQFGWDQVGESWRKMYRAVTTA